MNDALFHCCIVQGILSFLCAPLVGALSDVWGRKPFLILTVTFTCAPLPLMRISPMCVLPFVNFIYMHVCSSVFYRQYLL